jgi:NADH-quinone oxidoreductase subunit H
MNIIFILILKNFFWFSFIFIFLNLVYYSSNIYFNLQKNNIVTSNLTILFIVLNSNNILFKDITIMSIEIYYTLLTILTIVPLLVTIAFFTLAERKVIASIQRRRGPNVVGIFGLFQPFADGLKLLIKEIILPTKANIIIFLIAPLLTLTLSFISWSIISFSFFDIIADINLGLLVLFAISSFSVYGIILAGWSSNSRYPFLGALRSASQIISYEVSITVIFLIIAYLCGSFNIINIIYTQQQSIWFIILLFPLFFIFFISILAETNRAPFDLPEAEAEIVAGYNLEYSSIIFAIFFLGEYSNIILMSALTTILFFGGWSIPFFLIKPYLIYELSYLNKLLYLNKLNIELWFCIKIICLCFLFILVRATFPRIRYDQLIRLGWIIFLPFVCAFFCYCVGFKILFGNYIYLVQVPFYNF